MYKRVILKLSGEYLRCDATGASIDIKKLHFLVAEIASILSLGVEVAIILGGGNIIRGSTFVNAPVTRVTADQMGMLATIINGLALRDALAEHGVMVGLFSALSVASVVEIYNVYQAKQFLDQGRVLIVAGGTGNPLVTTDSAAALRAVELSADLIVKATQVDCVYTEDPKINPHAVPCEHLSSQEVLTKNLQIMDLNAILLCQNYNVAIRICNIDNSGNLAKIVQGANIGSLITA